MINNVKSEKKTKNNIFNVKNKLNKKLILTKMVIKSL